MAWPSYYPIACPPDDTVEPHGDVYRLVSGEVPDKKDFLSYWIKFPNRRKSYQTKGEACEACGLSVSMALEDAKRLRRVIPQFRASKIAMARLAPSQGRIKNTRGRRHYTWWVPKAVGDPSALFSVVA